MANVLVLSSREPRIVLERCDAGAKNSFLSMQSGVSRVKSKDNTDLPLPLVRIKNEPVSVNSCNDETLSDDSLEIPSANSGETKSSGAAKEVNDSEKSVMPHSDALVKIENNEEGKGDVTRILVGPLSGVLSDGDFHQTYAVEPFKDSSAIDKEIQVKKVQSYNWLNVSHTITQVKVEEQEEEKDWVKRKFVVHLPRNLDNPLKTPSRSHGETVAEELNDCKQLVIPDSDALVNTRNNDEVKGFVTRVLVGSLSPDFGGGKVQRTDADDLFKDLSDTTKDVGAKEVGDNDQLNIPHTIIEFKTEEHEEGKAQITIGNRELVNRLSCNLDDRKTHQTDAVDLSDNSLSNNKNFGAKERENSGKLNIRHTFTPIKMEELEAGKLQVAENLNLELGFGSESKSVFHSTTGPTKVYSGKTLQSKNKVLSEIHPKSNLGVKPYACSECPYKCHYPSRIVEHLRIHSSETPFEYNVCSKKFKTKSCLNQHRVTHTNERPFECNVCSKKFKTKPYLKLHRVAHSNKRPFECNTCSARFKFKAVLVRHLRNHSDVRGYSCVVCSAKFKTQGDVKTHSIVHTTEKHFECAHCNRRFKSKCILRKHVMSHSYEKPYSCPHCPSTFKFIEYLNQHLAVHSSEKLYTCAHCFAKLKRKSYLVNHMKIHSYEKPHFCPQCPMAFKHKFSLTIHLRIHTGEKPYSCPQCPAKFACSSDLKSHVVTHSYEKPFSCDHCLKSFKLKSQLKKHLITHETKRLHCCAHCCRNFKTQEALREHIKRVHIGVEKRFACNQCSYRTYSASILKIHLLVHSNEKPFSCDQCHMKFKTLAKLKRHGTVHTTDKAFTCDMCSATFKHKCSLELHLKKHLFKNEYVCVECPLTFLSPHSLKMHSGLHMEERKYLCEHCPGKFKKKKILKRHLLIHTSKKP